jgi:hypothetical protein
VRDITNGGKRRERMVYDDERTFHFNKRTNRIYISKRIESAAAWLRIASKVIDSAEGVMEAKERDQIVLRASPKSRQEIKAKFYEDSRGIFYPDYSKIQFNVWPFEGVLFFVCW